MKAVFDKTHLSDFRYLLTSVLPAGRALKAGFKVLRGVSYARWSACSVGILTLSAFLGGPTMHSEAQQYAALLKFTGDPKFPVRHNSKKGSSTNSLSAVMVWTRSPWDGTNLDLKLDVERKNEKSFSYILDEVGTARAESALASARVLAEDAMLFMERDTSAPRSPDELLAHRVASVFRETADESLGDYVVANYHPGGIMEILRETFLDNTFDKRIVSPLSPAEAGNPGAAYATKDGIHVGLRDLRSLHPRGFITFSDKAELDVTTKSPSLILRDPIYIDYNDKERALITALAVDYPDWDVTSWSIPRVGATLAYVHGNQSVNLTASAGRCNFESNQGCIESRYEEQIMIYTAYVF